MVYYRPLVAGDSQLLLTHDLQLRTATLVSKSGTKWTLQLVWSALKWHFLHYLTDADFPHLITIHKESCRIGGIEVRSGTRVWASPLGKGEDSQGWGDEGECPPLEDRQPWKIEWIFILCKAYFTYYHKSTNSSHKKHCNILFFELLNS